MEEIRDYLQTSQLPRFWKTFQQVSLVAERSLSKHPAFLVTCSAFSAVVILFPLWWLICSEQKGSLLCLPAAGDAPADQWRSVGSGTPGNGSAWGTLGGRGGHSMWSWRQSGYQRLSGKWAVFLDDWAQWWIYGALLLPQKGAAEKQGWGGKDQHWLSWQFC